jgi:hypothetical protein
VSKHHFSLAPSFDFAAFPLQGYFELMGWPEMMATSDRPLFLKKVREGEGIKKVEGRKQNMERFVTRKQSNA